MEKTCLVRIKTPTSEQSHLLERASFTIGRSKDADLPIVAPSISRLHLLVEAQDSALVITDQGSANGTFVNDVKLKAQEPVTITESDLVRLGNDPVELRFLMIAKPFELLNRESQNGALAQSMNEVVKKLEAEAQDKLEKQLRLARLESDKLVAQAKKEAEQQRTQLQMELQLQRQELEAEKARLQQDAQLSASEERLMGRKESDRLITEAQKQIQRDFEQSSVRIETRLKEAQARSLKMLEQAEEKARLLLEQAQNEASKLRTKAADEARELQQETMRRSELVLSELQAEFNKEVEDKRQDILAQARKDGEAQKERMAQELQASEEKLSLLRTEIERIEADRHEIRKELLKLRDAYEQAQELLSQVSALENQKTRTEEQYKNYLKLHDNGMARIEQEFEDKRNQSLVELEQRKKDQDQEIAKARLQALENLRVEIEMREKDYRETQQLRAVELSQKLLETLMPQLPSLLSDASAAPAQLKTAIESAAVSCIVDRQSSITAKQVRTTDAVKTPPTHLFKWLGVACALLLGVAFVYRNAILAHLKKGELNSYAQQLLDDRKARSVYQPAQTDEYRATYTDNVLYMSNYYDTKIDPLYTERWALRLNDLALLRSMSLNEEDIVQFVAKEANLVKRLGALRSSIDAVYLSEGLERMQKAEEEDLQILKLTLKTEANYDRIRRMEEEFLRSYIAQKRIPAGR